MTFSPLAVTPASLPCLGNMWLGVVFFGRATACQMATARICVISTLGLAREQIYKNIALNGQEIRGGCKPTMCAVASFALEPAATAGHDMSSSIHHKHDEGLTSLYKHK